MFKFEENAHNLDEQKEVVTSWFVNTSLYLDGACFKPRENLSLRSDKTEGAWDTLLTKIAGASANALQHVNVEVVSVNLHHELTQDEVVDDELDGLLGSTKSAAPLFATQKKKKTAPVFCYINCKVSSSFIDGELNASIRVHTDAPRGTLSALLAVSKIEAPKVSVEVLGLHNPRIKQVATLVGDLDSIV